MNAPKMPNVQSDDLFSAGVSEAAGATGAVGVGFGAAGAVFAGNNRFQSGVKYPVVTGLSGFDTGGVSWGWKCFGCFEREKAGRGLSESNTS